MLRSLSQWPRLTQVQPQLLQLQRVQPLRVQPLRVQPLRVQQPLVLLPLVLLPLVQLQLLQLVQLQPAQLPLLPPVPLASHRQRRLSAGLPVTAVLLCILRLSSSSPIIICVQGESGISARSASC
jgi:hypothetical protein